VLDHSDLPGYNQEQQLILAVLVGNHRKRLKLENLPLMRGVGIKQLVRLTRLLRLAVLLNNLRLPLPLKQLALKASGSNLTLTIDSCELELNHLLNADLEQEAEYMQRIDCALLVEYA
jgi:exopolyphosphatase/guanosine-5'-triphosphate,3'-diphosphate pyrophosphatase